MNKLRAAAISAKITDLVFHAIVKELYPGQKESIAKKRVRYWAKHFGAQRLSFRPIIASGPHGARPHGHPKDRIMQSGDLVVVDLGVVYNNICSDLSRTVVLGRPTARQRQVYKAVLAAQAKAMKLVKNGVRACDVDRAARDYLKQHDMAKYFIHTTGHGVGRRIHEGPKISLKNRRRLKTGQIVTVEPGVYIDGWGGVRIEDLLEVTQAGYRLLSHAVKRITI